MAEVRRMSPEQITRFVADVQVEMAKVIRRHGIKCGSSYPDYDLYGSVARAIMAEYERARGLADEARPAA